MFRVCDIWHEGRGREEVIRRLNVHLVREAELLYLCGEKQKTTSGPPKRTPLPPTAARATAAIPASDEETTKPSGRNKRYRGDRQTTVKCGVFKASRLLETSATSSSLPANHAFVSLCSNKFYTPACVTDTTHITYYQISIKSKNVMCVLCAWYESYFNFTLTFLLHKTIVYILLS